MTLIAAFRCNMDGHPGVVVCADSQETYGDYRVTVDKVKPRDAGEYDLIIGGAGNVAALIDGLANALEQNVKRWSAALDEESARLRIERTLLSYHARQVTHYPAEAHQKLLRFIVCVRDKSTSEIYLWRTDGTTAERVEDYALLGWEEAVYDYEVKWLYLDGMEAVQAVMLGVHLFTVARNSLYVGGPTQVIAVNKMGMWPIDPGEVEDLEERISLFSGALGSLMLALPDVSLPHEGFRRMLADFGKLMTDLREYYMRQATLSSVSRLVADPDYNGEPYTDIPLGTIVEVEFTDEEEAARFTEKVRRSGVQKSKGQP